MSRSIRHGVLVLLMASASASTAGAAGIERNAPSSRVLFEPGRYLEFSLTHVDPDLVGTGGSLGPGAPIPGSTGDILDAFTSLGGAFKTDLTDRMSFAVLADQPHGAKLYYPQGFYAGTAANIDTASVTAILGYDATPSVTAYGGIRAQRMEADGAIPFLGGYTIETDADIGYGYMLGVAYQKPEIALRVALTYYSAIEHDFDTIENGTLDSTLNVETPQQVHLEFQSGVAAKTIVFGGVRWVDWPQFEIDPTNYPLDQPMVAYDEAWTTYTLGIGRQITERLAGSFQVDYEPATDTVLTTLGPVDGGVFTTVSLSYDMRPFTIAGGVTYGWLGDTENELGTRFENGNLQAVGLRIGYRF